MASDSKQFRGVVVPMISPFTPEGAIDEPAAGRIVEHLIGGNVAGIFPLGTTGEAASIHPDDKRRLVAATVKAVAHRVTVYAGISSNCFRESVQAAVAYKQLGADAVVAHVPSYYPLSDTDVETYFRRLADSVPLPLVLYNIPSTTHHSIALDVVERLRAHPNIVALKDSANDAARLTELFKVTGGRDGFPVLLGNSSQFTHGLKQGGLGLVPSGAHLVPQLYSAMFAAAMDNRWEQVEQLQKQTDVACSAYLKGRSLGEGLAMLKLLLERQGLCERTTLPPLRDAHE
jgi:dihydrodipicolinate synthase/N-acetylneuraminate lyase